MFVLSSMVRVVACGSEPGDGPKVYTRVERGIQGVWRESGHFG